MSTRTLIACGALAVAAEAQLPFDSTRVRPMLGHTRDAGVLHLASGTWTRKATGALLGGDVIFDNTCASAYYGSLSGDRFVEDGRVPSPTSPTNLGSRPGCATTYVIDGFRILYCTDRTSLGTYSVNFYESYAYCSSVIGVPPTAAFAITQLPAAPVNGALTCWSVAVDLDAPPQMQSLAFAMRADGDGSYAAPPNSNLFGWSMECSLPDDQQTRTGPTMAIINFHFCQFYDGTRWDNGAPPAWPNNLAEEGTGMGSVFAWRIENGPTTPGCYFVGDCIAFHLELYADACAPPAGMPFCAGDGSGSACPCGNASAPGANEGCLNSLAIGGKLAPIGEASLANDSLVLVGSRMPAGSSALYFQGTSRVNGGAGAAFGDGLRCAGGTAVRLSIAVNTSVGSYYPASGQPDVSVQGQVGSPGVRTYQVWYRNSADFCTSSTFNLTNGWELAWGP